MTCGSPATMAPATIAPATIARADARHRKPWPLWRMILAYLLMLALASGSIWFIDRDAMRQQNQPIDPASNIIAP